MKIETKFVSLSLDIEEINKAIEAFLTFKGYEIIEPLNLEDYKKFISSSELIINAKKITSKDKNNMNRRYFPDILISRIGARNSLDIFIANISEKEMIDYLNFVFNEISEVSQLILNFAYEMDKQILLKPKSGNEILQRFEQINNTDTKGVYILRDAISEFSNQLEILLIKELQNNCIIIKNRGSSREEILETRIEKVGLSMRTIHGLKSIGVETLDDLFNDKILQNLLRIRNLGKTAVKEVNILKKMYNL